jgi:hypothetical protein
MANSTALRPGGARGPALSSAADPAQALPAWLAAPFLAIAAVCAIGGFIGLGVPSYWIDELFTLFVVDHHQGLGEVLARALTDTHPPGYYFILYEWIQVFGSSETAARSLSALFSVATLVVLFFALRGALSLPGRSFAVALAAVSRVLFLAAENARSYALCTLISAGLLGVALAVERRLSDEEGPPLQLWAGLWLLSLVAEYVHFYSFLTVGVVYLYLLLKAPRWRERVICVVSGLSLLALMSVYVVALLHSSREDLHNLWFSNNWAQLGRQALGGLVEAWSGPAFVAVLLLALAPWAARIGQARGRPAAAPLTTPTAPLELSGLAIAGVVASGLLVSFLIAPSFGTRNLYVLGPFFWALGGWLFDAGGLDVRRPAGRALAVALTLLLALAALPVRARGTQHNEDWRASAAAVAAEPACRDEPIPVVLPFIFGPSTPYFRQLAQHSFFGRYFPEPARLHAYAPRDFAAATADPGLRSLLQARAKGGCPILAWGVHDVDDFVALQLQRDIAETAGLPSARVRVREIMTRSVGMFGDGHGKPRAFIFERVDDPGSS